MDRAIHESVRPTGVPAGRQRAASRFAGSWLPAASPRERLDTRIWLTRAARGCSWHPLGEGRGQRGH